MSSSGNLNLVSFEDDCAEVILRESKFFDPEVRHNSERLQALLHPDFVEFGASGRVWNRQSIIETLTIEQEHYEMTGIDFLTTLLAPDVILLTFKTIAQERVCLRSSIWMRGEGQQWQLRFHQGTVTTE